MELILLVWIVMRFRWNDIYFNSSRSVFFPINLLTNKMNQLSVITTKLKKRFGSRIDLITKVTNNYSID